MSQLPAAADLQIKRVDAQTAMSRIAELGDVLLSCVEHGGGVGFVLPFQQSDAEAFWTSKLSGLETGERYLLAAFLGGRIVGTVMLELAQMPNGRHRADVAKLLVHHDVRRQGIARRLMAEVENVARQVGRSLLVLDTATGDAAETLYPKCGFERVGIIPGYARFPDGRMGATTVFFKQLA